MTTDTESKPEILSESEDALNEHTLEGEASELALANEAAFAPTQLGATRFVFAAFFGGGILIAFMTTKIGAAIWHALGRKWTQVGEPRDEWLYPLAIALGIAVPLYYFRKPESRQYAEEVADELAQVTWPSKKEVTNSTVVVVVTTLIATVFFALLDQFWRFVTDKIYGTGI
jgi:preprotein translocase subunit SecE